MFTFGQRGSHFFQCPLRREYSRLPKKLLSLITSPQLKQIHHVCLGYEDSFLLTWRDGNDLDRVDSSGLPSELIDFLYARDSQRRSSRNIPGIRCSLGPYNSSYFVHDGSAYAWMNLPAKLIDALQSRINAGKWIDRPRLITLGAGSDFVFLTEKDTAIWNLDQYKFVSRHLAAAQSRQHDIRNIRNLVLHPHRYQGSIIHLQNGRVLSDNLPPPALADFKLMSDSIIQDAAADIRRQSSRQTMDLKAPMQRKPSVLQQRAQMRREWGNHGQEFSAQAKGLKVSLSLDISLGGIARKLG
ncbi:hypothetical protein ACN47E_006919 [Coniothyrium glycines]